MLSDFDISSIKYGNTVVISKYSTINTRIVHHIIKNSRIRNIIVMNNTREYDHITENVYDNLNIIKKLNSYSYSFRTNPIIIVFDNLAVKELENSDISYLYLNGRATYTSTITTITTPYDIPMMLYVSTDYVFIAGDTDIEYIEQLYNLFLGPNTRKEMFIQFMNEYHNTNHCIVLDRKQSKIFRITIPTDI